MTEIIDVEKLNTDAKNCKDLIERSTKINSILGVLQWFSQWAVKKYSGKPQTIDLTYFNGEADLFTEYGRKATSINEVQFRAAEKYIDKALTEALPNILQKAIDLAKEDLNKLTEETSTSSEEN